MRRPYSIGPSSGNHSFPPMTCPEWDWFPEKYRTKDALIDGTILVIAPWSSCLLFDPNELLWTI